MNFRLIIFFLLILGFFVLSLPAFAGTVLSDYKYAWSNNSGYINFASVIVEDNTLSGYAWSANHGWINLNPARGGVSNDGKGNLSGYAWGENLGWIDFSNVKINIATGRFSATATGTLVGTLTFDCPTYCDVRTDWRPDQCHNGIDDDGDGLIDFPTDLGCLEANDNSESNIWGGAPPSGSAGGSSAPAVSDSVFLDLTPPIITITEKKDSYNTAENVILIGQTEAGAEIILSWANKYGLTYADENGRILIDLGKMPAGRYGLVLSAKDLAGNKGELLPVSILVVETDNKTVSESPADSEVRKSEDGLLSKIINFILPKSIESESTERSLVRAINFFLPDFLKFEPKKKETSPAMVIISKEAPLTMRGRWDLIAKESVARFVLSPLPVEIMRLAEKFPTLGETLKRVGIEKITDLEKLKTAKLFLPGLAEASELTGLNTGSGKFATLPNVPLSKLSLEAKRNIPTEVIFARTGGELIDLNIALTIGDKGEAEQKISTISGKPIQLVIKPDHPVKSVKGYLIFKSRRAVSNAPQFLLEDFASSLFFVNPVLAEEQNDDVQLEQKLVLLEFEYFDDDGDGIYTAEINAPVAYGEYEIITVLEFEDANLTKKAVKLVTVVDPEGYVYKKSGGMETRISGAIVSIFWLNPETKQYELWPAKDYQQENPQITDAGGSYSYLVPAGMYYLNVVVPGHNEYIGDPFKVREGGGVHFNIEMKTKLWYFQNFDWKTILLVLVIALLVYNFYRDKIRDMMLKNKQSTIK